MHYDSPFPPLQPSGANLITSLVARALLTPTLTSPSSLSLSLCLARNYRPPGRESPVSRIPRLMNFIYLKSRRERAHATTSKLLPYVRLCAYVCVCVCMLNSSSRTIPFTKPRNRNVACTRVPARVCSICYNELVLYTCSLI